MNYRLCVSSHLKSSTNATHPRSKNILVVDATNILSKAAADRDRWKHCSSPWRVTLPVAFDLYLSFLRRAIPSPCDGLLAVFDNPGHESFRRSKVLSSYKRKRKIGGRRGSNNNTLHPFITVLKKRGGLAIVAENGFEADDVISQISSLLSAKASSEEKNEPCLLEATRSRVFVASSDKDFFQIVGPNTVMIQLVPSTRKNPIGINYVDEAWIVENYGIPPSSMTDYFALLGNPDKNIPRLGLGRSTALKLLQRFGSLSEIVKSSQRQELKGWGAKVTDLFQNEDRLKKSIRLCALDRDHSLAEGQIEVVKAYMSGKGMIAEGKDTNPGCVDPWEHPTHRGRWRFVEPLLPQALTWLAGLGYTALTPQGGTRNGYPVDIVATEECSGKTVFVSLATVADFAGALSLQKAEMYWREQDVHVCDFVWKKRKGQPYVQWLNAWAKRHISELQSLKKEGECIVIPYFVFTT